MGLALLVWREHLVRLQSDLPRIGVTLLGCFSIQRIEFIKMNFKELVRNKDGLGASCLARRFGQTPKVINQEWV